MGWGDGWAVVGRGGVGGVDVLLHMYNLCGGRDGGGGGGGVKGLTKQRPKHTLLNKN